jgi:hypothetical protein
MIELDGHADAVPLRDSEALGKVVGVQEHVTVRQERALGETGRAGGELQVDRVVR